MELIKYEKGRVIKKGDHLFHHTSDSNPLIKDMDLNRYFFVTEGENGSLVYIRMSDGEIDPTIDQSSFDETWWILPTSMYE